ncbi:MAG: phosphoribosylformimino-5-aminoimidazole carboxamide ribotide isomerase [Fibrobacteres bacterium]|nr:phosphoribosylformimino-5-aminoimidazole carboxamide ribotide isomerase [Fibrobacterota bacterium]
MTAFRPCIDLHQGKVKQIVGGTLSDSGEGLRTNFVSEHDAAWFADLYRRDGLKGGHIIMLGSGNGTEALSALRAWPGGMQVGGGLDEATFRPYLDAGASHVIVTSWLFPGGSLSLDRLKRISSLTGKERLVVDLSCRRSATGGGKAGGAEPGWYVATNRWQTVTDVRIEAGLLETLSRFCDEFLIHAADVEGRQQGMDWDLVDLLARISPIPTTYAGGARDLSDLGRLEKESGGRLDLSIGSALDIFGGKLVRYEDCAAWNRKHGDPAPDAGAPADQG